MTSRRTAPLGALLAVTLVASLSTQVSAAGPATSPRLGPPHEQRTAAGLIGNNFHDECGDGGAFDLKKILIVDDGDRDVSLQWGTCPGTVVPTSTGSAITFLVDDNAASSGPEMAVQQSTTDATWRVFDTRGSLDEADWLAVQSGSGTITRVGPTDGGPRDVGALQFDAAASNFPLNYFVSVATRRGQQALDVLPDSGMPPLRFPEGCDYFEAQGARITTTGIGAFGRSSVAMAALHATTLRRHDGSRWSWPIDDEALAALNRLPGVKAERPVLFTAFADPEPTQWAVDQSNLASAWQTVPRAAGRIAVLDQGVDGTRADLRGHVAAGFDAIRRQPFPVGHDSALGPHGTAVSGIAAGRRDNGVEVAGVNDGATILPVRVFDHASCADDVAIAAGIDWAVANDADVINLSLGGRGSSTTLQSAVDRASAAGVIIIAATGNDDDTDPGTPNYPAAYPNVIGIGATDPNGVAFYSQRAATEFVAPGGAVSGARESDVAVLSEWNRIRFEAGTSYAAPFVSGLVSLWLRDHPGAALGELRAALRGAAVDLPGSRDGAGLIDAARLLAVPTGAATRVTAAPTIDGDPATSHRLNQDRAIEAALAMSALRFPTAGRADVAVLARNDTFADALSGAPLSADGPLLFTATAALDVRVRNELQRVVRATGTIYLLGGPNAVSAAVEQQLRTAMVDATIVRLAGSDRFATSRAIVQATVARYGLASQIVLARGFGPPNDPNGTASWADAIAGASVATARHWPLLIVPTDALRSADLTLINQSVAGDGFVNLLGGPNALSASVATQAANLRTTRRFAGTNRDATAARIAQTLWGSSTTGPRTFVLLNLRSRAGWYLGLASAGYAAGIGAPVLSMGVTDIPPETAPLVSRCGPSEIELWVAGARTQVSDEALAELDRRDGNDCQR